MDALLVATAFIFGLAAQRLRLPPLVGFLLAGFVLQALGQTGGEALRVIADLGVTLLLFTIGLKLRVRSLGRPEIWAGTSLHAALMIALFTPVLLGVSALAGKAAGLDWTSALLLAFGMSFSSTVFAVKSLSENGDMGSMHGRVSIGILIMQDILAVLFLTFSTGKIPSPWSPLLVAGLLVARPALGWLLGRSGHGELVTLCGFFLALVVGAAGFSAVGLKSDLGALFVGVLVGYHPVSKELGKSLNGITDLLLVGFFLQVGLEGELTWKSLGWAGLMILLLPLKSIAFFLLLTRFRLRARSSWMSALTLSTYSEFGLIVMALGVAKGWISADWLVATAVALSLSFLILAPLNRRAERLYDPISDVLKRFEAKGRHPDDLPVRENGEQIAIFGMGRVGLAAYHALEGRYPGRVIGFDRDPKAVQLHREAERNVMLADATDSDFWEKVRPRDDIDLVILAMPKHKANVHAIETLKRHGFAGVVAATGKFSEEIQELRKLGVDTAFNLYAEAGSNFARHVFNVFNQQRPDLTQGSWKARAEGED
ncbi:cation:proton antiporter family protein [Luteolibacter marinus]|uniref:cation:proton antiporter family protein n=1 Tax=Luteolibacter marinus TaxID=2776705 RepID=UPI0018677A22|nr:cation:proton antiporter family protein [Luteolibacter marinus]